jgi:hypothetical protein
MQPDYPKCPPNVFFIKRIYRKIVEVTDGSMGESNLEDDLEDDDDDKAKDDDAEEYDEDFLQALMSKVTVTVMVVVKAL